MSSIKNVIIIGAGGNLGPSVVNAFLKYSSLSVSVLSREGSSATFPSSVKVIRADYTKHDSLVSALKGQDAIVSLVGASGLADQTKLIDAAIAAGVQRFIPSEYGADAQNPKLREIVPPLQSKFDVVEYLKTKQDQISWTVLVTGPFLDWGVLTAFLGIDGAKKTASLIDNGNAKFTTTNTGTIGLALVRILEKPDVSRNAVVYVSSAATTQNEVLAAAEKITGEKWTVNKVSAKEHAGVGQAKLAAGDFSGVYDLIQAAAFGEAEQLADASSLGLWNEKLGLEPESLEDSVRAGLAGKLLWQV